MRVIAVDDEKLSLMRIERILREVPDVVFAAGYQNPLDALACQEEDGADIAFLDVEMPDMSGLALAERLMERNPALEVVFVTAHEKYALSAYQQNAIGYLLKPVQHQDVKAQLERIRKYRAILKPEEPGAPHCSVFGSFYIYLEPDPADILSFRTEKSAELLALLIHHRGRPVSRDMICELLWPNMTGERALRNFHTTAYNIRHTFSEAGMDNLLLRHHDSYRINPECIHNDLEIFCRAMEKEGDETSRIQKAEAALSVYHGVYMADKDYLWLAEYQAFYEHTFERLCLRLSEEYEKRGELQKAENTALRWLRFCPLSEEACARLIRLYQSCGEARKAGETYENFRRIYLVEMGEEPSGTLNNIYND